METLIGFITVDSDSLIDILEEAEERALKRKQDLKNDFIEFLSKAIVDVNEHHKYHRFLFFKWNRKNYIPLTEEMVIEDTMHEKFLDANNIDWRGAWLPFYHESIETIKWYIDYKYEPKIGKANNFLREVKKIRKSAMDVAKVMISIEKYDELKYKYGK